VRVVGVDGYPKGWVAVSLVDGWFESARLFPEFKDVLAAYPDAAAIGVDIPIGQPALGEVRRADREAKRFVGPRHSSVFLTPPRAALEAKTHQEALAHAGLSRQAFALARKILEVDEAVARAGDRVHEVHPEVSFAAMAGRPLDAPKRSWRGLMRRRKLLAGKGVELPDDLASVDAAAADDLLDAAVAAWSADRIARGVAKTLPKQPNPGEPTIRY
jgi:predicted RNase H-like nuclease